MLYNAGLLSTAYIPGFLEIAMCSIALSTGIYYLVEKPALRLKNRWAVATPVASSPGLLKVEAAPTPRMPIDLKT